MAETIVAVPKQRTGWHYSWALDRLRKLHPDRVRALFMRRDHDYGTPTYRRLPTKVLPLP